jgi:hypothetical protein
MNKNELFATIDKMAKDLAVLSDTIFDNPENSGQEFFAMKLLADYLEKNDFKFTKLKSGFLLANTEGLTMTDDKSSRQKYGNSRGDHYIDQYGNTFSREGSKDEISVTISQKPDIEVLSSISDHITSLRIEKASPLSDISFLKRSSRLEAFVVNNSSIKTFEPLNNSARLKSITINNPTAEAIESLRDLNYFKLKYSEYFKPIYRSFDQRQFPSRKWIWDDIGFGS